jgi:two-component system, chemotaxis family, sensor kinase CheA
MDDSAELIREFLIESGENLDQMDRDFVKLEDDPSNIEILAGIFRAIHTIKGTCGFFGFSKLESVTHVGENLLSKLRDGELHVNSEITTALLQLVDAVREMLASIEASGEEGAGDYSALVAALTRLQSAKATEPAAAETGAVGSNIPTDDALVERPLGQALVDEGKASPESVARALERQSAGDPRHIGELLIEQGEVSPDDVVDLLKKKEQAQQQKAGSVTDSSIRVDVGLLDKLMNMVGELVLARNQTVQYGTQFEDSNFQAVAQRLSLITTELQEGVMKTRMQPIGNVWSKFPRIVRDVSSSLGKQVRLEMEGQGTELDKTVLEAIKDPLTHIVRNSVDHGLEPTADRIAAGKPAEGLLLLRAYHEGGQVIIEISDDGRGVNVDRVRAKAVERGLVTEAQVARMSEREIANLVFLPGFSTAEKVTNISGRGVGMDVVKTNIEKIGGAVELRSETGRGTTLKIKIPLTLAIVPALIVMCGQERYAIPQVNLLELVRLEQESWSRAIETVHGCPVYRLRGKLLPLIHLRELLRLEEPVTGDSERGEAVSIVVLQAENRQFGLVVESVQDTEEIVVKPLGSQLKHIEVFAGAAIMGDGRIALILDVMGIGRAAQIMSEGGERTMREVAGQSGSASGSQESLLLVRHGETGRMAIPLSVVARLEDFETGRLERVGERTVIQYREQILPLFHLGGLVEGSGGTLSGHGPESAGEPVHVVVYSRSGQDVGLVVDEILDISNDAISTTGKASRPGVRATAVVHGKVTEILDIERMVELALTA